jgi:serine/threonine-protein kinase
MGGRGGDPRDDVYAWGRVLEDVLHRLTEAGVDAGDLRPWWALVERCLGSDEHRPADGAALARDVAFEPAAHPAA